MNIEGNRSRKVKPDHAVIAWNSKFPNGRKVSSRKSVCELSCVLILEFTKDYLQSTSLQVCLCRVYEVSAKLP